MSRPVEDCPREEGTKFGWKQVVVLETAEDVVVDGAGKSHRFSCPPARQAHIYQKSSQLLSCLRHTQSSHRTPVAPNYSAVEFSSVEPEDSFKRNVSKVVKQKLSSYRSVWLVSVVTHFVLKADLPLQ